MDKLCLKWTDFQENITSSFRSFREGQDFSDVTLVCEEGKQIEAHRVILSACSPFFRSVLKMNNHSHPMIYMRGLKSKDLVAIVDFIYHGEANIYQDDLDGFLAIAVELQLKGVSGLNADTEQDILEPKQDTTKKKYRSKTLSNQVIISSRFEANDSIVKLEGNETEKTSVSEIKMKAKNQAIAKTVDEQQVVMDFNVSKSALTEKIESMMVRILVGENKWKCKVCGKETKSGKTQMARHVESHLEGVSHPCNQCGKVSRSSNNLLTRV